MNPVHGNIALIGGGKMGRALIQGMLAAQVLSPSQVVVIEKDAQSRQWWADELPEVRVESHSQAAIEAAQTVLLAVKPHAIASVAETFKGEGTWSRRLVISVAAGVPLARLQALLQSRCVVRVMPNTPCLVGAGASAFSCGEDVSPEQAQQVATILGAVGLAFAVEEKLLDAVTGLSGSGPAYVFVMIEALADGGVAAGLPRDLAQQLAAQTLFGAAKMVLETGQHPAVLKDAVASPGGTTIAGVSVLEQNGVRSGLIEAVKAATARSQLLGSNS